MITARQERIAAARRAQPMAELERKANKAMRPGWWTVEDFDLAKARAEEMYTALNWDKWGDKRTER